METKTFKMKLTKLFQSSFTSCRSKHISDDISDQPFFFPENHHHHRHLINLFSPNPKKPNQKTLFPTVSKPKTATKKKPRRRKTTKFQDFASVNDNLYYNYFISDDDDEEDEYDENNNTDNQSHDQTTLFSSRSFTSDSSVSRRKKNKKKSRREKKRIMKDSVAVVKKSRDPQEDFRVSMLEMIVERQIFGVKDLESLLECFLSLNSEEHHRVICDVFTEIWETLFSDWF